MVRIHLLVPQLAKPDGGHYFRSGGSFPRYSKTHACQALLGVGLLNKSSIGSALNREVGA